MTNVLQRLNDRGLVSVPKAMMANTIFLGQTGSVAYGAEGQSSDIDVYGIHIPRKSQIFPHLDGYIPGFGKQPKLEKVWVKNHIIDPSNNKEYDFQVYSIVRFFQLAMENNPNICDILFLPPRCILHRTPVYQHLREHRKMFLSKKGFDKFRGYALSQMTKIKGKANSSNPKRMETIEQYGYDVKFGMHLVRLLLQLEQMLMTGDIVLDRDSEVYKSIRRGEWTLERLEKWQEEKERSLELMLGTSTLRDEPDEDAIKTVLLECLEMHYGELTEIQKPNRGDALYRELRDIVDRYS